MRRLGRWWIGLVCVAALTACENDPVQTDSGTTVTPDGSIPDAARRDAASDRCSGRDLCTTAGTSCSGDQLVTCALDTDGCLVETRVACDGDEVCDVDGGVAACVDPCEGIAAADRCETNGARACNGASLEVCEMNADGCLVLDRTACDDATGGLCDTSGTMPVCVMPADPCASVPAADRCTTAGTSCDGESLVTCAANAFGCLVATRADCSARAGGTCEASGTTAACDFTGNPCEGITQCATAGTRCDGPSLVTCAADAYGCRVETRTACTDAPFGFCDATATPAAMCSTAATDPCMGVTECGTATSRSCTDAATLSVCAPNAFGCFVATTTACGDTGEVCSDDSGTAMCVSACLDVTTCTTPTYCDGDDIVTCTPDAAGCLVATSRETCDTSCAMSGTAAICAGSCNSAEIEPITCASGTITGDTAGAANLRAGYSGCSTLTYPGEERIYRFQHTGPSPVEVRIVATRLDSSGDFDLFAWSAGDGTVDCLDSAVTCIDSSTGTSATETVEFLAAPGTNAYVGYDRFGTGSTTRYSLAVTCTPIVCGDSAVGTGETCDDGNTTAGDGCSATCQREPGYSCMGTPSACTFVCGNGMVEAVAGETCDDGNLAGGDGCSATCQRETGYYCTGAPSVCSPAAANAECSTARVITGATTITGENAGTGGPRPTGTGCGSGSGAQALYYAVTIPPRTSVLAQTTPISSDLVLFTQSACGTTTCLSATDAAPERAIFDNTSAEPMTRIVGVRAWGTGTSTYDIAFTYTPIVTYTASTEIAAVCEDMAGGTAIAGLGADDATSAIFALPFAFTYFGAPVTHFSAATNGFLQLWPSATGTPSSSLSNTAVTSAPNGFVGPFWDDLRPNSGAGVSQLVTGTAGSRRLVLQWTNWRVATTANGEALTLQAHLVEGSNLIEFHYCTMTPGTTGTTHTGTSATIGLRSVAGNLSVQSSYNTAAVSTGAGIRYTPDL